MMARLAVVAWVLGLSGCTCGIALCSAASDCGPDASCDQPTGVCVFEGTGAGGGAGGVGGGSETSLALLVPPLAARPSQAGTVYEDAPPAWRRNDQLFIWLEASRPITGASLKLGGVDVPSAPATSCTLTCTGACYCFAADLSRPPLPSLRGAFDLAASGLDPAGKTVTASGSVLVTRLLWRRGLGSGQQLRSTPAIGADGTLYVGTTAGPSSRSGTLYAISPGGQERWNKPLGKIEASVAVSAPGLGAQRLFVAAQGTNNASLNAFDAAGGQVGQCLLSKDATLEASPALIPQGAAFYASQTRELIAFRPGLSPACTAKSTNEDVTYPDSLVAAGAAAFFVDEKPSVLRYDLTSGGWQEFGQGQWPGAPISSYRNRGLAMPAAGILVGAGELQSGGTVFQAEVSGNFKFDYGFSPPRVASASRGPVVAAGGLVLVGISTGIAAVSPGAVQLGLGDRIANTPALGEGGRLYALAENGALSEWTYAQGKPVRAWTATIETGPLAFEASPALDCARDPLGARLAGRPGVLYAAGRAGALTAIIVDARGIDTTAQWPKYQKDPRNSGTLDTALAEFACP